MIKKKMFILSGVLFLFISCDFIEGIFDEDVNKISLAVSAGVDGPAGASSGNSHTLRVSNLNDEQYYKTDRKAANRGSLLYTLTPESFVLDIDDIVIYRETGTDKYDSDSILKLSSNPDGLIVPKHLDLAYADDFIRDVKVEARVYDGISMQFQPQGDGSSNDGYYIRSITGVSMPAVYDGVIFNSEISGVVGLSSGLRYFGFEDLQPIETNSGFLSYLTIGANVAEDSIDNPEGVNGEWINPVTETTGNSISLFFSSPDTIDVSEYSNPEVLLNWDLEGLIQIWDNKTPSDYSDDIITYNLSKPFPVSLMIQENAEEPAASTTDTTAPSDVIAPAISGSTTYNTLQWINPRDQDFREVVVIRKEGSSPADISDGEEVYRSYIPNYVDSDGQSGTHFYYLVKTVDYSGNYSDGVELDQVQP